MDLSRISRDLNKAFLDDAPLTGLQSIQASYQNPYQNLKYIGSNYNDINTFPAGPFIGALNISNILINADPFLKYTGDFGANIILEYKDNKLLMNSGYLTDYIISCDVGSIPIVQTKWNIYNDFGSGQAASPPFSIDETALNIISPGDISINFNDIIQEKINRFDINIKCTRLPIYHLEGIRPKEVILQYPIEIITSFSLSLNNYKIKNLFDYPSKAHIKNFSIDLKKNNTETIIHSFNISNALLISEDYNTDIDSSTLAKLTFSSTMHR